MYEFEAFLEMSRKTVKPVTEGVKNRLAVF